MLKRILTGAGLVVIIAGFFFLRMLSPAYFQILIMLFAVIGTFEILRAVGKTTSAQGFIALIFSVVTVLCSGFFGMGGAMLGIVLAVVAQLIVAVICHSGTTLEGVGSAMLATVYPSALLATFTGVNLMDSFSTVALLMIFIVAPFADTFAFFVGCAIKGPKLCPNVSPKKTISGAIGGVVGGIIGALAIYFIYGVAFENPVPPMWFIILVGAITAVFTEVGDLAESIIKRKAGVKDMGNLLPGHGGVLDRIDGMMFAGPIVFMCFRLFMLIA